ncbi:MAG: beta strand repeat-containing protein, partial [Ferrovibrionaceae bacterium]
MDPLFTSGNDTVDINGVVAGSYLDGTQYAAGGGNDTVILPDAANAAAAGFVIGTAFDGGAGADTITGGDGNDLILGGSENDSLAGGGGNDTLDGGTGADTLDGGTGSDTVTYAGAAAGVAVNLAAGTGGDGDTLISIENVVGSGFADTITGATAGGGTLDGGNGNDTFILSGSANTVIGGAGSDTVSYAGAAAGVAINLAAGTGGSGDSYGSIENAIGSAYADTITGAAISGARLDGGAGDDIIVINGTSTTVVGGSGNDTVSYANAAAGVAVNLMTGAGGSGDSYGGIENVIGSAYNDTITGGTATGTVLDGGAGNDTIVVRRNNTTVIGGSGTDTVSYANATAGVTIDLVAGTSSNGDSLSGIEGAIGSAYADTITGGTVSGGTLDGGNGDDLIAVNAGGTTVIGGGGKDMVSYASAAAGVSVSLATGSSSTGDTLSGIEGITGSAYVDTLTGGTGDDTLDGGAGADILDGGAGNDTVSYFSATAAVTVDLVAGTNSDGDSYTSIEAVTGSSFNDTITGGSGQAWTIDGGAGNDVIVANAANTVLMGGAGADTITGFSGVETAAYWNSTAGVTVSLATGTGSGGDAQGDVLSAINNLEGSAYGDSLTGDANANKLSGLDGNDVLNGGDGNDSLYGGNGNDTLNGGNGVDTIDGGAGGLDWVSYADAGQAVDVRLYSNSGGWTGNVDSITGIEGIRGTAFNDFLYGRDNADDWFEGGAGADEI